MIIDFDCEFIEDGKTIELISIGAVREDGKEFYMINSEMPVKRISKDGWLMENVIPPIKKHFIRSVTPGEKYVSFGWQKENYWKDVLKYQRFNAKPKKVIASEFKIFCGTNPIFYGYFCDYDWVLLCQLYGRMIDLPEGWPMYCRDLKQTADEKGFDTSVIKSDNEHDALSDARWNRNLRIALQNL